MTTVISLLGAPGSGKSTIAAKLFAMMKENGHSVEAAREYVKAWANENRNPAAAKAIYNILFPSQIV